MRSTLSYIRESECVAMGDASPRDAPVIQSWRCCLDGDRLDPTVVQAADVPPKRKLSEHREQAE